MLFLRQNFTASCLLLCLGRKSQLLLSGFNGESKIFLLQLFLLVCAKQCVCIYGECFLLQYLLGFLQHASIVVGLFFFCLRARNSHFHSECV